MKLPEIKRAETEIYPEIRNTVGLPLEVYDRIDIQDERLSRAKWARVLAELIKSHWTSDEHIKNARKELLRQAELDEGKGGLK